MLYPTFKRSVKQINNNLKIISSNLLVQKHDDDDVEYKIALKCFKIAEITIDCVFIALWDADNEGYTWV